MRSAGLRQPGTRIQENDEEVQPRAAKEGVGSVMVVVVGVEERKRRGRRCRCKTGSRERDGRRVPGPVQIG